MLTAKWVRFPDFYFFPINHLPPEQTYSQINKRILYFIDWVSMELRVI